MFAYAFNDPVNLTDPSGQAVPIAIAIARVAVGAAAGAGGGWVAGKIQGSTVAAVLGGVVGGLAGGLIGLASPEMSSVVGGMIGGAIAGTIGGGLGGYTGKYLADPESSLQERLLSGTKGAGVGVLTGLTIGGISTASILLGAAPWAGDLVGTLAAQPIAIGLGLVPFPWWGLPRTEPHNQERRMCEPQCCRRLSTLHVARGAGFKIFPRRPPLLPGPGLGPARFCTGSP